MSRLNQFVDALEKLSSEGPQYHTVMKYLVHKIEEEVQSKNLDIIFDRRSMSFISKDDVDEIRPMNTDDCEDMEDYSKKLSKEINIIKFVKERMQMFDVTIQDIMNACGIEENTFNKIMTEGSMPYEFPVTSIAKLFVFLGVKKEIKIVYESVMNSGHLAVIKKVHLFRNSTELDMDWESDLEIVQTERKRLEQYMIDLVSPIKSLQRADFQQLCMRKIKKEKFKKEILSKKAEHIPVIKDPIKDKLATVVPDIIVGKSTDQYLNEIQRLRERLLIYDTFGRHFKKALEKIDFQAPALERRFGFKANHTTALLIDELYPFEIDIKTFVPVCKFLKFRVETLIPQLENTFLLLQLKKMGEGTTKEKLEKLSQLSPSEKRKWEDGKNRLEAWIRRLTPVITRTLDK